jgi:hypothetical protein
VIGTLVGHMPTKAPWCRFSAVVAASFAAWLLLAAAAFATPPPPSGLEVQGGEDAWHPDRSFRLRWHNPAGVAAVHYLVRDPLGMVVAGERLGWAASEVDARVGGVPGAYLVEVWLEDGGGAQGAPAEARLRFDDARPAATEPHPGGIWIGRTGFPFTLRLAHPAGEPLSGIRGYAVAVDPTPGREPCAAPDRCSDAETDLQGGVENDAFAIPELPEGTSYVGAVAVSGAGIRSATTGRAVLRVDETDPVTRLSGAPAGWSNHPLTLTATATDAGSGMRPDGGGAAPFTAIRVDGETPIVAAGGEVSTSLIAEGTHTVAYYARDLAGNLNDGGSGNGMPNRPPSTAQVRIDRTAPGVAFSGAQDPLDPELIRARVADSLSGPDPARGWIGIRRAGSGDPFQALPRAQSPPGELRARWDSDAYPPGEYEFEAGGYDRAGNATKTQRRADGGAMTLTDPLKTPTVLLAGFGAARLSASCERRRCEAGGDAGRRPASRIVRYGRTVLLSGRLTGGGGWPLPGTQVRIVERFDGGLPATRESTVRSGANGDFAARLPAGPSREVLAVFDGSPTLARAASRPLRLAVRSSVRLRASSTEARVGGAPLVFRGQVAAASGTIPPGGVSVQLQFRVGRLAWSEFRTVRTDDRGRFRYTYRFSDDDSRGVRFQFRAYVSAQSDWPYEPGSSRPVIVRGL